MEFRILGPLEVLHGGRAVPLGGSKQRAVLATLLLHVDEVVPVGRLIDELWGDRPPGSAAKLVQGYVSGLRRALGAGADGALVTRPPGYRLRLARAELDLFAFDKLVREARAAAEPHAAVDALRSALALWRGPALAGVTLEAFARQEAARLDERRLAVLGERIELDLELGRHAELIGELEALAAEHPFQERLRAQLMLALYRSGRHAEALSAYRDARRRLDEELGLAPGAELKRLERLILRHDPSLQPPAAPARRAVAARGAGEPQRRTPAAPSGPARVPPAGLATTAPAAADPRARARKTVTVLFADLVGWSSLAERLDAESLHEVQARYHEAAAAVLERHGGTVEKFIGDAAVAVFGVPVVHEDDALRAVRAALEIRETLARLNEELERDWGVALDAHIAVNTGEVVTGPASSYALASGDAMIVAARLQQAAAPGEILLGPATYELVRDAVDAEAVEPLRLKGRSTPVAARRLVALTATTPLSVPAMAPLVGRAEQLAALEDAFARAVADRSCRLCTVVGPPGIGKSRLARELATSVEGALVLVGRCLAYGEGITFWPLTEIVRQLAGTRPRERLLELLRNEERAPLIVERLSAALGLAESAAPSEETFWAVRKLFERLAREQPLIVVVDDVHWAEATLLDLIEYLVGFSSDAPILILCLARPDLLDQRPAWAAPRPGTRVVALEALSDAEARMLIDRLSGAEELPPQTLRRIVGAAEGNPLFLEQLHAFRAEQGGGKQPIPPGIHALLAARIERLEPDARTVLEYASIEGRTFHLGALATLLPPRLDAGLSTHLTALARLEFIRADRPTLAGEDAFRFRHVLIRDAAYAALPKQLRARLHERFAAWLDARGVAGVSDEIVGFHLEQAYRYREALGRLGAADRHLAREAGRRLAAAGRRATSRGDAPAAAGLLDRALSLLPPGEPGRLDLLAEAGTAFREAGQLARAEDVLAEGVEAALAAGDRRVEALARIELASLRLQREPLSSSAELLAVVESALPVLEALGDEAGLARAWHLVGLNSGLWRGRYAVGEASLERALVHARRAGDSRQEALILSEVGFAAWSGPTSNEEATRRCELILAEARGNPLVEAGVLRALAALAARRGAFEEARGLIARARSLYDDLGAPLTAAAGIAFASGGVELLAQNFGAAERELRAGYETLAGMGETGYLSSIAAFLAEALYFQGRDAEAERFTRVSENTAASDDVWTQILFRTARAKVLARRGDVGPAEAVAREAVELAATTDALELHGNALLGLADVLRRSGRPADAAQSVAHALELFERKGNVVSAARAREALRTSVEDAEGTGASTDAGSLRPGRSDEPAVYLGADSEPPLSA